MLGVLKFESHLYFYYHCSGIVFWSISNNYLDPLTDYSINTGAFCAFTNAAGRSCDHQPKLGANVLLVSQLLAALLIYIRNEKARKVPFEALKLP